jgi:hypothetical protein
MIYPCQNVGGNKYNRGHQEDTDVPKREDIYIFVSNEKEKNSADWLSFMDKKTPFNDFDNYSRYKIPKFR